MKLKILLVTSMLFSLMIVTAQTDTIAVLRIGGVNGTNGTAGSSTPGTGGSPIHIDKFTVTAGVFTYVSSLDLPVASTDNIFASSSTSEGYLIQSPNKQWLSVTGYAAKAASGTIYSTASNGIARTLGLLKQDGTVDLSTKLSNFPLTPTTTAATPGGSITSNGSDLWCVTSQGNSPMGVLYTTPGATDASTQASIVTNATPYYSSIRSLSIFGGDLYWCAASLNRVGLVSAIGGLPTVAGASTLSPISIATGSTPINNIGASQIMMFDLDSSIIGYDVMYVTNTTSAQSGIYKYCKNAAGKWVSYGTYGSSTAPEGGYFGITGKVINGLPILYVTRGISATQNLTTNQILQLTDNGGGYNATMNAAITAQADATTSGKSGTIRGVAFYASASSFYYKGTGNLNDVANWGINTNGSGTAPTDFITDGQTFFINNGASATLSANWVVSGIDSKIIVGDGTNTTSLTIPATNSITADMDVYNNATLNILNTQAPHLHYVALGSTVNFNAATAQTIRPMAFGNFSNNNNNSATLNGQITVANTFSQNGLLQGNATLVVPKGLTNNGTMAPGNSPGMMNVKGKFTNGSSGILNMELGGNTTAGVDYDLLSVDTGKVVLDGTLNITIVNGFVPVVGQSFTIITDTTGTASGTASISGTFATVNLPSGINADVVYNPNSVVISITSVLPLKLKSFKGSVLQVGTNKLEWTTENESNVDFFSIERSLDGNSYTSILLQVAKGSGNNNYTAVDNTPLSGFNFYRLKMIDKDGTATYSQVIKLKNNVKGSFNLFPNPAKNDVIVSHQPITETSIMQVSQADGKVVMKQQLAVGAVQTTIDISSLKPGAYILSIYTGKQVKSLKLTKE